MMDVLKELKANDDTPFFNSIQSNYRKPALDFMKDMEDSPIFDGLYKSYSEPKAAELSNDVIELKVVRSQELVAQPVEKGKKMLSCLAGLHGQYEDSDDPYNKVGCPWCFIEQLKDEVQQASETAAAAKMEFKKLANASDANLKLVHDKLRSEQEAKHIAVQDLTKAIVHTVEYVGLQILPAIEGWSWYDAIVAYNPVEYTDIIEHIKGRTAIKTSTELEEIPTFSSEHAHLINGLDPVKEFKQKALSYFMKNPGHLATMGDVSMTSEPIDISDVGSSTRKIGDPYVVLLNQKITFEEIKH